MTGSMNETATTNTNGFKTCLIYSLRENFIKVRKTNKLAVCITIVKIKLIPRRYALSGQVRD